MKKFVLLIALMLTLVGCSNNTTGDNKPADSKRTTLTSIQPVGIALDEKLTELSENGNVRVLEYDEKDMGMDMSFVQYVYIPEEMNVELKEKNIENRDDLFSFINDYIEANPENEKKVPIFLQTVYSDDESFLPESNDTISKFEITDSRDNKINAFSLKNIEAASEADKENIAAITSYLQDLESNPFKYVVEFDLPEKGASANEPVSNETAANVSSENFDFSTLSATDINGNPVDSSIFKDKYTLVNIWGTFCNPCIVEMPDLAKIHETYSDKGYNVIGIISDTVAGSDQNIETAHKIIEQTGVKYTNIVPTEELLNEIATRVQFIPTTFIVDSEGRQVGAFVIGSKNYEFFETLLNTVNK